MLSPFVLVLLVSFVEGLVPRDTCTVTTYSQVANAVASCTSITINGIDVPANTTLDLTKLKTGATVTFSGTTTFGHSNWLGPLMSISGTNITVKGSGTLDGLGAQYWDGLGGAAGVIKPQFWKVHNLFSSKVTGITIKNAPVGAIKVNGGTDLVFDNVTIDDSAAGTLGRNTDGFDLSSVTGITIQNSKVYNQDDCIAVIEGSNIFVSNMYCSGGHGLSIGSIGSGNVVNNVTFTNSQLVNSENGIRIKTRYNDVGKVTNVKYSNIQLSGITKKGLFIDQAYGATGDTPGNGVPITGLTLSNITGSVGSSANAYDILCGTGTCSNWSFSGVKVTGGKGNSCNYQPSGFTC